MSEVKRARFAVVFGTEELDHESMRHEMAFVEACETYPEAVRAAVVAEIKDNGATAGTARKYLALKDAAAKITTDDEAETFVEEWEKRREKAFESKVGCTWYAVLCPPAEDDSETSGEPDVSESSESESSQSSEDSEDVTVVEHI